MLTNIDSDAIMHLYALKTTMLFYETVIFLQILPDKNNLEFKMCCRISISKFVSVNSICVLFDIRVFLTLLFRGKYFIAIANKDTTLVHCYYRLHNLYLVSHHIKYS